jgi:hypothetical protein
MLWQRGEIRIGSPESPIVTEQDSIFGYRQSPFEKGGKEADMIFSQLLFPERRAEPPFGLQSNGFTKHAASRRV